MFAKSITIAALVAVASSQVPAVAKRDFELEARQAGATLDAECQNALSSILPLYSELPSPPSDLMAVSITDACATPTFTGQLSSDWASYTSEALGWYTSHSAEILSALSSCSALIQYATAVPVCTTAVAAVTTDGTTATTGNLGSTAIGGSVSTTAGGNRAAATTLSISSTTTGSTVTTNAAPRENGLFAAGFAAAAFVGAVIAL